MLSSTTGGVMSWTDPAALPTSDWHLTGNLGTSAWNGAAGNIIGTLDAQDFVIGTGAVAGTREKVRITQAGNLQLSQPGTQLSFLGTGAGVTTFQAGAQGANTYNLTLPITTPAATQVLGVSAIAGAGPFAVTLAWQNASSGSFVNYNTPSIQNTAVITSPNYLYNVAYAAAATTNNALGAVISSVSGTGGNSNATGLAVTATANGTGTSKGLNVTVGGGTTNYAALFNGGNVGIGQAAPTQLLEVRNGNFLLSNSGAADQLQFQGTSTGLTTFQAGAQGATNINYTLPTAAAVANGYVLSSTTGGVMSWTDPAALPTSDWHLTGNLGTSAWNGAAGNIIGTLDAQDFVIGTGAVAGTREKVRITQAGNLQLSQPGTQLSFLGTGTGVTTFQAGAQGANAYNLTLPITTPAATQVLGVSAVAGAGRFAVTLAWQNASSDLS